ncbi:MAG: hypothetical protein JRJ86_01470 [Deltaproteobacteria bacterium]|nr:hypothetical protein [Deltaproteobacteria bacterium]MBW2117361.1 hypothetical protein [Deltaproteobacteria bacterium]
MARYDRVIPPGGMGNITVTIDSGKVRGDFRKKAIIRSNDPKRMSVVLYLEGEVIPHISIDPGGYLSLSGVKGKVAREHLDIINNHKNPMKVIGVDSDLRDHIVWHLKEIKPGYVSRLEVEDISKTSGDYTGHLIVRTDRPEKPELVIIINGHVSEK